MKGFEFLEASLSLLGQFFAFPNVPQTGGKMYPLPLLVLHRSYVDTDRNPDAAFGQPLGLEVAQETLLFQGLANLVDFPFTLRGNDEGNRLSYDLLGSVAQQLFRSPAPEGGSIL